jgi:hypothetical protein
VRYLQVNVIEISDDFLLLWRNNGGVEIWRRARDVLSDSTNITSPLRKPSELAASASQLEESMTIDSSRDLRGVYVPHGFLPSFTGAPFRIARLRAPCLAVIGVEASHVIRLYDVVQGVLLRSFDLDAIIRANSPGLHPSHFVLLDLDLSAEYLCACFDCALVVVALYEDLASGRNVPAFVYTEEIDPAIARGSAWQASRSSESATQGTAGGTVFVWKNLSYVQMSGVDALEPYVVRPPTTVDANIDRRALVPPHIRWSSCFVSGGQIDRLAPEYILTAS